MTLVVWDSKPLVPVTVTTVVTKGGLKVQDSVALPEPLTLFGLMLQAALLTDRLTVPAKPFSAVTAIVDVAVPPVEVTDEGFALRAKSTT